MPTVEAATSSAELPIIGTIPIPTGFPTEPNQIIASAITLLIAVAGIIFFFMLVFGGIRYLTVGGDEKAAQEARRSLTNAAVGLIIIVAAFLIAQLLFAVFGLNTLVDVINRPPTPTPTP